MRSILFFVVVSLASILNIQAAYSQSKPTINSVVKKSYNGSDISCSSSKDAELTIYASGGTGGLEYSIDNGNTYQSGNVFSNLEGGITYAISVRDSKGKVSKKKSVYVKELNPVTLTGIHKDYKFNGNNDVSCFSVADGEISIDAWGGTGTLQYSADNGITYQDSKVIKGLAAGTYQVIVQDENGCTATSSITLVAPEPVSGTSQASIDCGATNGSVTVTGAGGVGLYDYSLDGGSFKSSGTFNNMSQGEHQVQVKDHNGCIGIVPVTLISSYSATISGTNTICSGGTSNFIINISSGNGTVFSAIYKDNSDRNYTVNNLTTGNNTITTEVLSDSESFTLVSVENQNDCAATISGTANIHVTSPGQWLGINSNWNDPVNWSCGSLPTSGVNVTISAAPNNPVISLPVFSVNNLIIDAGATLTVNGTLQISGSITNNGNLDITNGTLELKGSTLQTISGSWFVNKTIRNLKISNAAGVDLSETVNDTLNISGLLSFGVSNATFNTENNLTLKSTATGTAGVADITNNGANRGNTIIGDVIVERYINVGDLPGQHNKSWVMISAPTQGQTIKQSWMENGNDASTGYGTQITGNGIGFDSYSRTPALKYYDDVTDKWVGVTNTNLPVYDQKGYMLFVRGDRSAVYPNFNNTTLRTKGTLLTGTLPAVTIKAGKFQSVGNPYASEVDIRKISATGISPDIIIWDPTLTIGSVYGLGAYQTLYKQGENYVNLFSSPAYGPAGTVNNYIKSGLAFFVQAPSTDGELTFTERSKSSQAGIGIALRNGSADEAEVSIHTNLYGIRTDGSTFITDGTVQQFSNDYSNEVNSMDSRKILNSTENLSIRYKGNDLVIERRNRITSEDTIYYNLTGVRNQNYRFEFDATGLQVAGLQGFIEDNYTKTETPLNPDGVTNVDFTVTNVAASRAANRFNIFFKLAAPLPVTVASVKATQKNEDVSVEWKVENQSNMQEYEIEKSTDGNQFTKVAAVAANKSDAATYSWLDQNANTGYNYYRIRSVDVNGQATYTQIVKVQIEKASSVIKVYPNPAINATVNIQLINQPSGIYYVRLLNPLAQVIISKQILYTEGSKTETIKWSNQSVRGNYHLEITKPNGSSETFTISF